MDQSFRDALPRTVTPQAMVSEVQRLLDLRGQTYAQQVQNGLRDEAEARYRLRCMRAVLEVVLAVYAEELALPQDMREAG